MTKRVLAIDGPAGCGKSTVARELARALDGVAFSSGTVYRAATLVALDAGTPLDQPRAILAELERHRLELVEAPGALGLLIDGVRRDAELHGTRVSREIHWIADDPSVRERLLPIQREARAMALAARGPVVAEGRDIGTVVFPDAEAKIFLTASVEERAQRRSAQLAEELRERVDPETVRRDVERRDRFDSARAVAPLAVAAGARVVDTTGKSVAEVVESILKGLPEDWVRRSGT